MNRVLSVESAGRTLSLCLKRDESFFEIIIEEGLKHSENLMESVQRLLAMGKTEPRELELLVCSLGPGSFTGLRIGMATVKGMAYGLGIPYVAVPSLAYMAYGYDDYPGLIVPLLDAKKNRFYTALYKGGRVLSPPQDISKEELFLQLSEAKTVLFTGPDAKAMDTEGKYRVDPRGRLGHGRPLLLLGVEEYKRNGGAPTDLGPLYLRKSEAEITKEASPSSPSKA